jgi:hypothetical protein
MTATQPTRARPEAAAFTAVPRTAAVVVLALLVLSLRLPSLFEPHHYGDEGVFAATAQQMLAGDRLYAEIWDNKPPLVFLVYAAVLATVGPSMLALRLVGVVWSAATALVVLMIGRRVGGEAVGWPAALLYAVLAALPLIEGTLLLTEHLMVLPAALGVLLALSGADRRGPARDRLIAGAGACLGIAFLFKQVAAFDAAAVGLWLLCRRDRPLRDAAVLVLGWTVPVAVIALWLTAAGALGEAWQAVVGSYGTYLGEGSVLPAGFQVLRLMPAAIAVAWLLWRRWHGPVSGSDLIVLWLGFAVLGATAGGRPFGHYLVQMLAPAALVTAHLTRFASLTAPPSLAGKGEPESLPLPGSRLAVSNESRSTDAGEDSPFPAREGGAVSEANRVRCAVLALALLTALAGFRGFWFSHPALTPAYYGNWLTWVVGEKTRGEHDRFYSWRVANQQGIARLIEADGGERTLYVWGEYPWLYALTNAEMPVRYTTAYQTSIAPGAKEEVMDALERDPPRYIAEELEEWRRLPGLREFRAARYEPVAQVDNTVLWRRVR